MNDIVLAHGLGGAGGPEIEALILAGAMLAAAVVLRRDKLAKPWISAAVGAVGIGFGIGAFVFSGSAPQRPDARVEITSPSDGATVQAEEPTEVRAEVYGGRLTDSTTSQDPAAGHLHVIVDDELISMPSANRETVKLPAGEHEIAVEFTSADHRSFSPRILDRVQVTAQ